MDASKTSLPLESESKRVAFKALMKHMRHPFLYSPDLDVRRRKEEAGHVIDL